MLGSGTSTMSAAHAIPAGRAAGLEDGVDRAAGRVLEHERARRSDAVAQRAAERLARKRLAAQEAVLVRERDADQLDAVLVDHP